ncbi:hypothetical protein EMQ25_13105 [Arsenicitalea aurantiaca]|uniref:Uncharacterized protein n=1 Tax=Arsenicitalea aurantiaca TaxID=1783274 RepID=A0A433X832_9HYPH|nr:hypothetical protein [Arsenicitalea aurantiaca]RUT30247.1 hypothetical protein EMQ25_13105 [Arsenicitalea aurantiaca]
MHFQRLGRAAGMVVAVGLLAGCIDASVDIEVLNTTEARATLSQTMGAEFYAMVKMGAEQDGAELNFCDEGTLEERADGSAVCTLVDEGPFDELDMGEAEEGVRFTLEGPNLVRVSLPTAEMAGEVGAEDAADPEAMQMMQAIFAGRAITVTLRGAEIVESNLTISEDRTSAEIVIPMLDLIGGDADLPEALYAVVRVD